MEGLIREGRNISTLIWCLNNRVGKRFKFMFPHKYVHFSVIIATFNMLHRYVYG